MENSKKIKIKELLNSAKGFSIQMSAIITVVIIKAFVSALVLSYPIKWLWNGILELINYKGFDLLTFCVAFKLAFLSSFLFNLIFRKKDKTKNAE